MQFLSPHTLDVVSGCHEKGGRSLEGWGKLRGHLQAVSPVLAQSPACPSLSSRAALQYWNAGRSRPIERDQGM